MKIVVLTGAGISAESGLPTFRDADGLWEGHDPMQVATPEAFEDDPDLVQRFYDERRSALDRVQPNAAHVALARLEEHLGDVEVPVDSRLGVDVRGERGNLPDRRADGARPRLDRRADGVLALGDEVGVLLGEPHRVPPGGK